MPMIKEIHIPLVTHTGFLDREKTALQVSRDGPGIAVSTCPDIWRQITRTNAPDVVLSHSAALWVDAFAFTPNCIEEIISWAKAQGYLSPCPVWHANWIDEETGAFRETTRLSYEAALRDCGSADAIMRDTGLCLQARAVKRLGRWHDHLDYYNAALILYTREVIIPKRPLICGIWWNEVVDIPGGVAPSGQLMPEALAKFDVENDDGDLVPFSDAFPDFKYLGAKPVTMIYN